MQRPRITPTFIALAFAVSFTACAERRVEGVFRDTLARALAEPGPSTIDLATALPIAWDSVAIINPYSSQAAVDSALGFHWPAPGMATVMHDDRANALVFVQAGRVQRVIVVDRRDGDFCCDTRNRRYARTDAVFEVVRDGPVPRLRHLGAGAG